MGLYLGSTKIPAISFYKSGAIMPSGIFNIPSNVSQSTYDVTSYAFAQGDFGYGRLPERISGDISEYTNLSASQIVSYAFISTAISSINMPGVTRINISAFTSCNNLSSVSFPSCTWIGQHAFAYCSNLSSVSFPECLRIENNAFMYDRSLTSAYFPKVTYVGGDAFWYCSYLTSFSMSLISALGNYAFEYCFRLESAYLPKLTSKIAYQCFWNCSALSSIYAPSATGIEQQGLAGCINLLSASFPYVSFISGSAFQSCYTLLSLYLMSTSMVSLGNTNAFSSTPISNYTTSTGGVYGSIYVPASLLNSYKAATNWATYSNRIVGV